MCLLCLCSRTQVRGLFEMSVRVKKFDSYSTAAPLGRRRAGECVFFPFSLLSPSLSLNVAFCFGLFFWAAAGGGARSVFGGRVYEELCARKSDSGWEEDEEDGIVITKRPSELQGPPRVRLLCVPL